MFSTRLNPTKPPAAHRALLERVGAACRELRPIEESCIAENRSNGEIAAIFARHGLLGEGINAKFGGAGSVPLLDVMAAERIGREGVGPCAFFVSQIASHSAIHCRLLVAAGAIGAIADCLEIMAQRLTTEGRLDESDSIPSPIAQHIAQTAADLEATRALVYAAAELKAEYDRHPDSKHLALETDTLLYEAQYFAYGSVERMRSRAAQIDVGGTSLLDALPPRHREPPRLAAPLDDSNEPVEHMIARYYLFL